MFLQLSLQLGALIDAASSNDEDVETLKSIKESLEAFYSEFEQSCGIKWSEFMEIHELADEYAEEARWLENNT